MLQIYNTLTRKKEDIVVATGKQPGMTLKLYTCGPTVYHFAHIGNLRTYIWEDILERVLEMNGYGVDRVMNITDVGHLTSDADEGEDKMDKAVAREGKSIEDIIRFYTDAFVADCEKLTIRIPSKFPRASHHIQEQQDLITALFEKGLAYDTPEAVYFDTSKFPDYGALSGQKLEEKTVAARESVVTGKNKKGSADFALWFKLTSRFAHHAQHWPSPWGEGFPGWHLECSALIHTFLGEPIDIHTGGVDHIGTHHTNEIAQSEGAYGVPLSRLWMHGEHLLINDDKMAKSGGNSYILQGLIDKGYDPLVFRYLCLNSHYRTNSNFTWESMEAAKSGLNRLYRTIYDYHVQAHDPKYQHQDLSTTKEKVNLEEYRKLFWEAINDDLNTPKALGVIFDMLSDNTDPIKKLELIKEYESVLGIGLAGKPMEYSPGEDLKIAAKVKEYEQLRSNKQFIQSDGLRKEIEALGYSLRDTENGTYVSRKFF